MSRLPSIQTDEASPKAKELLEKTHAQLGRTPNLYRTMANSPATLEAYLGFRGALIQGNLTPEMRERVALLVAEKNHCEYCVSAHMLRGAKIGVSPEELQSTRLSHSQDLKTAALLQFGSAVLDKQGRISDEDYHAVKGAGWNNDEIGEIIAHVVLNIFSNYYNHMAQPELDFPRVEVGVHE